MLGGRTFLFWPRFYYDGDIVRITSFKKRGAIYWHKACMFTYHFARRFVITAILINFSFKTSRSMGICKHWAKRCPYTIWIIKK